MIWVGLWVAGALAMFRPIYRELIGPDGDVEWADIVLVSVLALLLLSVLWPAVPIVFGFRKLTDGRDAEAFNRRLAGESSAARADRLESERAEQKAYIEGLERELGIGT